MFGVSTSVSWFNTGSDVIHAKMGALERVWRTLKPLLPTDMVSFISYFESTWVRTSTTSPLFSHDMWNQHDASLILIPRSSNIAEGWHHGSHSMLSCSNPTLWKFLDALKSEQALMQTRSCHGGSPVNYQSHEPPSG